MLLQKKCYNLAEIMLEFMTLFRYLELLHRQVLFVMEIV